KSKEFIRKGEYPGEEDTIRELDAFANVLINYGVKVYRPEILDDLNQIFTRDICFVIDNKIVVANVLEARNEEVDAIKYILDQIAPGDIIEMPDGIRAEGGDVMPWEGNLFIGYSEPEDFKKYQVSRTNREGVEFIKNHFPHYKVYAFELVKS